MQFDLDKNVRYGLAYSGGVDSCYLLAELLRQGFDVKAYTILDDLQITRDTDDSVTIASMLGAEQEISASTSGRATTSCARTRGTAATTASPWSLAPSSST